MDKFALENIIDITPTYNRAPGASMPIIIRNRIGSAQWGLVPSWAVGKSMNTPHNARIETAAEKPFFRDAWTRRRCLIPASGFYEWEATPTGKQPVYFHYDDEPFAFAGLWEKAGDVISFTILTQNAAGPVKAVHHRMPVIIPPDHYDAWFDKAADVIAASQDMMQGIECRTVSRDVNNTRNDSPALINAQ